MSKYLLLLLALTSVEALPAQNRPLKSVTFPDPRFQTLNDAAAALTSGGKLIISTGVFRGPIIIANKTLTIVGSAPKGKVSGISAPELTQNGQNGPSYPEIPVIQLSGSANVTLQNLQLTGGMAGVQAVFNPNDGQGNGARPNLVLSNVNIIGSVRGISGSFNSLNSSGLRITRSYYHGLSLRGPTNLKLKNCVIENNKGVGVLILNDVPPTDDVAWVISKCRIEGNQRGGIEIQGGKVGVIIDHSFIRSNVAAGITLHQASNVLVYASDVSLNHAQPDAKWGDGVRVFSSSAQISGSSVNLNDRAGASIFGCEGDGRHAQLDVGASELNYNAFDFDLETYEGCTSGGPELADGGGNTCLPGKADGEPSCHAASSTLSSIPALTPP